MHARFIAFGQIEIDGQRFGHDVAGCGGGRRDRRRPTGIVTDTSRWSPDEAIPWSAHRLIVGTGAAGQLPITPELYLKAERRGIEIVARRAGGLPAAPSSRSRRRRRDPPRDMLTDANAAVPVSPALFDSAQMAERRPAVVRFGVPLGRSTSARIVMCSWLDRR
jgi:hypothetical protein